MKCMKLLGKCPLYKTEVVGNYTDKILLKTVCVNGICFLTEWPESGNSCAVPVAMDTASPWESQQPSSTTEPSANWAKFDEPATTNTDAVESTTTTTTTSGSENWADFSSFSSLSR